MNGQVEYSEDVKSQSRFFMIRCLIAIAHIDNVMHPAEEIYLWALINHLSFEPEQLETIRKAFREPEDIALLAPKIVIPKKKLQLMYFARILVYKDEALHINEIDILERLERFFKSDFDMKEISAKTEAFLKRNKYMKTSTEYGIERAGYVVPWFQLFDEFMLDLGLDFLKN